MRADTSDSFQIKMCFIAPYKAMGHIAEEIIETEDLPHTDVFYADFDDIESIKNKIPFGKYSAFITRGAIASFLRANGYYPVFEVGTSSYDIISSCKGLIGSDRKVAVVGHESVVHDLLSISDMLEMNIFPFCIDSQKEITNKTVSSRLEEFLEKNDIEIIIGDAAYKEYFNGRGYNFRLLRSGKVPVRSALLSAYSFIQLLEEKRHRDHHIDSVLALVDHAVLSLNFDGTIKMANQAAASIFGCSVSDLVNKKLLSVDPGFSAIDPLKDNEFRIKDRIINSGFGNLIVNRVRIDNSSGKDPSFVVSLQKSDDIAGIERKVRYKELANRGFIATYRFEDFVTRNAEMQSLIVRLKNYANTEGTVLIYGESGTGKEVLAQSIHNESPRCTRPFVAVNCGAFPADLLESELFGYVEGAFTGASRKGKKGLFELAHGGTIFLDEVSELDVKLQSKLLRVIQERQVMRLGSDKVIPVDVRIIAATNKSLPELVTTGRFREDLYYRINVLRANILPLRCRREDILPIAYKLLDKLRSKHNSRLISFDEEMERFFYNFDWPGNVRQLSNVIERLVVTVGDEEARFVDQRILFDDLTFLTENKNRNSHCTHCFIFEGDFQKIRSRIIRKRLDQVNGNKSLLSKQLGVDRATIYRWLNDNG